MSEFSSPLDWTAGRQTGRDFFRLRLSVIHNKNSNFKLTGFGFKKIFFVAAVMDRNLVAQWKIPGYNWFVPFNSDPSNLTGRISHHRLDISAWCGAGPTSGSGPWTTAESGAGSREGSGAGTGERSGIFPPSVSVSRSALQLCSAGQS